MLNVRKARITDQYQISAICPVCNSDMVRDVSLDISNIGECIIDRINEKSGERRQVEYQYGYRCINSRCGHTEHSTKAYPFQMATLDLAGATYQTEEEYNNGST